MGQWEENESHWAFAGLVTPWHVMADELGRYGLTAVETSDGTTGSGNAGEGLVMRERLRRRCTCGEASPAACGQAMG